MRIPIQSSAITRERAPCSRSVEGNIIPSSGHYVQRRTVSWRRLLSAGGMNQAATIPLPWGLDIIWGDPCKCICDEDRCLCIGDDCE